MTAAVLSSGAAARDVPVPVGGGVCGSVDIVFARRDGATRLTHLHQRPPLRVLFPLPEAGDLVQAAIATTSGGLVAGDRLAITVAVGDGAAAHVTAAAAEKVYRSLGTTTAIEQRLIVGSAATLEFLLPDTILFDQARLRRNTVVELAANASFLGGEIVMFGRHARGEKFTDGFLHEDWQVWRDGRLVWGDALHLDGDVASLIAEPAALAGAVAVATLILAPGPADPRRFLDAARAVQAQCSGAVVRAGATRVGGLLVARWLGYDDLALRRAYADLACHLRAAALGLPSRLSRLWHI